MIWMNALLMVVAEPKSGICTSSGLWWLVQCNALPILGLIIVVWPQKTHFALIACWHLCIDVRREVTKGKGDEKHW
jgi:hypothetical protein